MKKEIKLSFGVKWILFKLWLCNIFRIIFRRKIKKSVKMKKVLKNILKNAKPIEIPEELKDRGFYKLNENDDNIKIEDLIRATNLATASVLKDNQEWELSVYDGVLGYEDTLIITYTQIFYSGKQDFKGKYVGTFVDKTFSYQTQSEKVKNFILRFSLSNQE